MKDIEQEINVNSIYTVERFEYMPNAPEKGSWVIERSCTTYAEAIMHIKRARTRKLFHSYHYRIEAMERTNEGIAIHHDIYR